MHTPGLGVVWDSKYGFFGLPYRRAYHTVLPTKTSRQYGQVSGSSPSFLSIGSHVSFIIFVNLTERHIFVAVTLSLVSLSLIARCHRALISPSDRVFSCMTRSHLKVHTKYMDSVIRIWNSRVGP